MADVADFARLDDPELIEVRRQIRAELQELAPDTDAARAVHARYSAATAELDHRARLAWRQAGGDLPGVNEPG